MTPHPLIVVGKPFELILSPCRGGWHWLVSRPGAIVLSGEAASEAEARRLAAASATAWLELNEAAAPARPLVTAA
jgi:hypothetical protein